MHIVSSLALILALVATSAQAASPDSPERRSNVEASLAEWLKETNSTCTTDITARFDWSVAPDEDTNVYDCHTPVEAIRASCKDWPEKDAVKEQIRAVACVFGTAGGGVASFDKSEREYFSLKDGLLTYNVDYGSKDRGRAYGKVSRYLQDRLVIAGRSLKWHRFEAEMDLWLARNVKDTNRVCGSQITARIDWASRPQDKFDVVSTQLPRCGDALSHVERICHDRAGKAAVRKQIRSLVCSFAGASPVDLADGVLTYKVDLEGTDRPSADILEFLQNRL
jgi:hypothetical protein